MDSERFALTPLMCAAMLDTVEAVIELLEWGADINWSNDFGMTALSYAAMYGSQTSLIVLLD